MLAFPDDAVAAEARRGAARRPASPTTTSSSTPSAELYAEPATSMMRNASGAAGFGYEITLMRRYMTLRRARAPAGSSSTRPSEAQAVDGRRRREALRRASRPSTTAGCCTKT